MTRIMYDGVSVGNIPADATAVALYIDGRYANWRAGVRRFRKANKLSLTVFGDLAAQGADCEPGNMNARTTAMWVQGKLRKTPDGRPVCYGSRDRLADAHGEYGIPAILEELAKLGIPRAKIRIGSAHYGLGPHICSPRCCGASFTADGTQHLNTARYDEWLLDDSFFPPAPARKKLPKPKLPKPKPVHKKVLGSTAGTAIAAAILLALRAIGVSHLNGTEESFIASVGAAIGGWAAPPGYVSPRKG